MHADKGDTVREIKRRNLVYYLDIEDTETGNMIGKLADISSNGVLLLAEQPIDSGFKGTIEIKIPFEGFISVPLPPITVETRWNKQDRKTGHHYYGMEFTGKTLELEKAVAVLIAKIGFSDGEKKARRGLFSEDFY